MRPARKAVRPASTPSFMAVAMATGSCAFATAVLTSTQSAPTSIASDASDGAPMPAFELLSYFLLLVVAGNETTRNAASGGLLALIEHPDELAKLRAAPALVPSAGFG